MSFVPCPLSPKPTATARDPPLLTPPLCMVCWIAKTYFFVLWNQSIDPITKKKSCIRETKHLLTDADSSTDAIGGWTKAKSAKKKLFFYCAAILDHFQTKMYKC